MTQRLLAGLVLALALLGGPARAKPPVWIIHGKHATLVLFGSIHVLPGKLDWEPGALAEALAHADELWFETPLDDGGQAAIAQDALRRGFLPAGQSLSGQLSDKGRADLKAAADLLGLPLDGLERLRPWYADLTIAEAAYLRDGARPDEGVERRLLTAAPQARRRAFETAALQIGLFADSPLDDQVASLEDTLNETLTDPTAYRRLVQAWMDGDLTAIDREAVQPLAHASPGLFKTLVADRNARWTEVLSERLKGRGLAVVVVGVGHLIGPDGVPTRLRARGARVEGPGLDPLSAQTGPRGSH